MRKPPSVMFYSILLWFQATSRFCQLTGSVLAIFFRSCVPKGCVKPWLKALYGPIARSPWQSQILTRSIRKAALQLMDERKVSSCDHLLHSLQE